MAYFFYSGYEELVADYGEGYEEIDGYERMEYDRPVLPLQLREESRGEVVDSRRRTVSRVTLCKTINIQIKQSLEYPIDLYLHLNLL